MNLLAEVTEWLAAKGLDQWQGCNSRRAVKVETDVAARTVFVVEHRGRLVATITVDEFADADFWLHKDDVRSAFYIHRMAVRRDEAGQELGSAMLDWAAGRAQREGRSTLRLDAWVTNGALHSYYKNLGFVNVRSVLVDGRGSGALFERPAAEQRGAGPGLIEQRRRMAPAANYYCHRHGRRRIRRVVPLRSAVA